MLLCHYLTPQAIVLPAKGKTKIEVLGHLVSALAELHHLRQPKKILHAILEREKAGSTFLPIGVAIPHARLSGIEEIKMVMGILPHGLAEVIDGHSYHISIVCLFLSPLTEKEFGRHLKLLACIAAFFREERFLQELVKCTTPAMAFTLMQRWEREAAETHEPPSAL